MIYVGRNAAPLYHGDYRPAALYRGSNRIAGYRDEAKSTPCAWENTYNDAIRIDAIGRGEQAAYSGKNLLNPVPWETPDLAKDYIVKYLPDEDCFFLDGTFAATGNYAIKPISIQLEPGAMYSIQCGIVSGSFSTPRYAVFYLDGATNGSNWVDCMLGAQKTKAAVGAISVRGWFYFTGGAVCDKLKLKIQLEKAAAPTFYEPYVGGVPSPNPDYPQLLTPTKASLMSKDRAGASTSSLELPVLRQILGTTVRDELHEQMLIRRVGVIDSYNGEDAGDVWCSTTGQLTTGATVWYQLPTPVKTTVSGVLKTYPGYTELAVSGDYPPEITATARVVD